MANVPDDKGSFLIEHEEEHAPAFDGRTTIRTREGKFGFVDKYSGKVFLRKRVDGAIELMATDQGKWPEEVGGAALVIFPDIETFAGFVGRGIRFVTDEEWARELGAQLDAKALEKMTEKEDGPVIKFRQGQMDALNNPMVVQEPWETLDYVVKEKWRARYAAAKRDLGIS